jgi:hypothetical protein
MMSKSDIARNVTRPPGTAEITARRHGEEAEKG